jgi:excisionase family DNA binding protein
MTVGLSHLLTKKEVANLLRVSERTVDRLRLTGRLRSMKVGSMVRFDTERLSSDLAKCSQRILIGDIN